MLINFLSTSKKFYIILFRINLRDKISRKSQIEIKKKKNNFYVINVEMLYND